MNGENTLIDTIRRRYIWLAVAAFLLIMALFFGQFAIVRVTVAGEAADQAEVAIYQNTEKAAGMRQGLNIVRRGTYSLRATTENELSERHVDLKPFRMNQTDITLEAQRGIQKVASNSQGCVFALNNLLTDQAVYTYACSAPRDIVRYSFIDRPISSQVFTGNMYSSALYPGGILSLAAGVEGTDDELRLALVGPGKVTPAAYVANPEHDPTSYSVLVSTKPDGKLGNAFVVADSNKKQLVYFEHLSDSDPEEVPLEASDKKLSYAIAGDTVFVLAAEPGERTKKGDVHDFAGGTLKQYRMQGGTLKETSSIDVPKEFDLVSFEAIDQNTLIVAGLEGETVIYRLEGNTIKVYDRIESVDDLAPYKNGFVLRRGQDYFYYDSAKKESRLVYRLSRMTPSTLQNSNGQLVLSALVNNSSVQYSFVLLDSPRDANSLVKILNYPAEDQSIRAIDYNDKSIYVEFSLTSFTSDRVTGQLTYDPQEIADKQRKLVDVLKLDGIDTSKYRIIHR